MSVFDPTFEDLGTAIPIFPLSGVLLLPGGRLPLNIFEPRYLNLASDALKADRFIGMIQPTEDADTAKDPTVYSTGCAGRITSFEETEDGRYLITLKGTARFNIVEELETELDYRRVVPDWTPYAPDLEEPAGSIPDRNEFLHSLRKYFDIMSMDANWDAIEEAPCERLVTSIAMICPFEPPEKQALLEAPTLENRVEILTALVNMAIMSNNGAINNKQ